MGKDEYEDELEPLTELNVTVSDAALADVTIDVAGNRSVSVPVHAEAGSAADSEPSTLAPATSVRPPATALPGTSVKAGIEARLHEVYAGAPRPRRPSVAAFGPIITPSEPFLVTGMPRSTDTQPDRPARAEPTLKLGARRDRVEPEHDDETMADAMRMPRFAELSEDDLETAESITAPAKRPASPPLITPDETAGETADETADETAVETSADARKQVATAPLRGVLSPSSPEPAQHGVAPVLGRGMSDAAASGAAGMSGGTVRIVVPPENVPTASFTFAPTEAVPFAATEALPAPRGSTAYGARSSAAPAAAPSAPVPSSAGSADAPPPAATSEHALPARVPAAKKRGSGRALSVVFFLAALASTGGVFYSRHRPAWVAGWLPHAPIPAPAPPPAATSPPPSIPSASAFASVPPAASASSPGSASASSRSRPRRPPRH